VVFDIIGKQIKRWYVEKVLREKGLTNTKKRQPRVKGRSKYMQLRGELTPSG